MKEELLFNTIMNGDDDDDNDDDDDEPGNGEEPKENGNGNRSDDSLLEKLLNTRTVLLTGEINKRLTEKVIKQLILMEASGDDPIKVFIDSPGGDADAGFAIFDFIRFIKPQVITVGMGLVASAAAIVLLAAKKENRVGFPNSHYLIHQPLSGIRGVATEIEIHARELDKIRKKIDMLISLETGQPLEKVTQDTDRDYWLAADEALNYGLISRVITTRTEL